MKKLRVAVFNTQPPHLYFGGVERRVIEVAKDLTTRVKTTVYSGTKKGFSEIASCNGTTLVPCSSTDMFFPLDNWSFNRTISKMLDTVKADVYEGHAVSGYGFLNVLVKHNLSSHFIQTIHGVLADEYVRSHMDTSQTLRTRISNVIMWRLSKIEHELATKAGLVVTVSQYSLRQIVQYYGVDPAKIRIVPNGVDCLKFRPIDGSEKTKQKIGTAGKKCILFVGRLIPRKGLPFLIQAAEQIVKERKDAAFVIVGDGPLRSHLVEYLKKIGLSDYFVFLGDVSDTALPEIYNCADVFALPSIQEGQGIALLEAQATGKPVVAFDVGAVGEALADKETGLLVKPESDALAKAVLDLISNETLRERMGTKGREFVCANFSWSNCAEKMLKVYHEALL